MGFVTRLAAGASASAATPAGFMSLPDDETPPPLALPLDESAELGRGSSMDGLASPTRITRWVAVNRPEDADLAADAAVVCDISDGDGIKRIGEQKWEGQLSPSDRNCIQLARALISNPQVLVLQRPVDTLEREPARQVLDVLSSLVQERGSYKLMGQEFGGLQDPLARTVIFSCSVTAEHALGAADAFIVLGRPDGGATVMASEMFPHDASSGETRSASLSRQLSALLPRDLSRDRATPGDQISTASPFPEMPRLEAGPLPSSAAAPPPAPSGTSGLFSGLSASFAPLTPSFGPRAAAELELPGAASARPSRRGVGGVPPLGLHRHTSTSQRPRFSRLAHSLSLSPRAGLLWPMRHVAAAEFAAGAPTEEDPPARNRAPRSGRRASSP